MFLACRCVCREGRTAPCIFDIKSITGWSPLAVCSTPPPRVLCSHARRQRGSVLFSFPHHLPSQIPPSVSRPGVEFQPGVENKRERNPKPTCSSTRRDRSQLVPGPHHSVIWPLPPGASGAPLGASGCWGLVVPGWGRRKMGNAGLCTQWDSLSLHGQGCWQHSPP